MTCSVPIVAFGGGTGLSQLLLGLKKRKDFDITAVVTMSDDGGSSGRLRKTMGILPPGDIRNCIVALSELPPLFLDVLQYRFYETELEGHSFGNLFLAVLTRLKDNFEDALEEAHHLLKVRGKVLPCVLNKVSLEATHHDGTKTTGQARITHTSEPIVSIRLLPRPKVNLKVLESIWRAKLLIFGPGSLYTSTLTHLIVPEIREEVMRSKAKKVYICNPMTQPGETNGFAVEDHLKAFGEIGGGQFIDYLIINSGVISQRSKRKYLRSGSIPVVPKDLEGLKKRYKVFVGDFIEKSLVVRHNADKLAQILFEISSNDN